MFCLPYRNVVELCNAAEEQDRPTAFCQSRGKLSSGFGVTDSRQQFHNTLTHTQTHTTQALLDRYYYYKKKKGCVKSPWVES